MRLAAVPLIFVAVATLAAGLLSSLHGSLVPWIGGVGLAIGLVAAVFAARATHLAPAEPAPPIERWEWGAWALFAVVAVRQFGWLLFHDGGIVRTPNAYNYGDLPLHITYVEALARGVAFWPENPVFTGERLRYPIGMDLWNALLLQIGVPLALGLKATGLAASALLAVTLRRWGRGIAVLAFLLSGGLDAAGLAWLNLFLSLFVTQRGFLFALPAGLVLLVSWRERLLLRTGPGLPPWVEGVLWSALPLFHLHSFLLLSVIVGLWTLARGRWRASLAALAVAVVPASLGVYAVTDHFRAASLLGWAPGWVIEARPVLPFLARNFGLVIPLAVLLAVLAARRRPQWRLLVWPAVAIWAALFFVKLAPWAWDNTKVMVWCYVLLLPAAAEWLLGLRLEWRAAVLLLWLWPGSLTVWQHTVALRRDLEVYRAADQAELCPVLAGLPADARVATRPTFNHPVALCGQPIVEGYAGHLWSHGIDSRAVDADLKVLMLGQPDWRGAARRLHARWLYWGRGEAGEFAGSSQAWSEGARVLSGPWGRLYSLPD